MFVAPRSATFSLIAATIAGETSTAITRSQTEAAASAKTPVPAPKSISVLAGAKAARSKLLEIGCRIDTGLPLVAGYVSGIEVLRTASAISSSSRPFVTAR
jgi:hypothetical protein